VSDLLVRAGRLAAEGRPYALATVVNVVRPASARRGDRALITPEGNLEGWVGGACSEPAVVEESLRALQDGKPRLVRICPPGDAEDSTGDVVVVHSSCASEGQVEVLVEPCLPAPLIAVVGDSPAAATLRRLVPVIGWRVGSEVASDADAVVVATMGRGDEGALAAAVATDARYVGLVASGRRAAKVIAALRERGLGEQALARVHSPAGLDLGSSNQEEIAVAILAQLIAWRHTSATPSAPPAERHSCHEA
jgi:xanthine dehydrogenase accessory factor